MFDFSAAFVKVAVSLSNHSLLLASRTQLSPRVPPPSPLSHPPLLVSEVGVNVLGLGSWSYTRFHQLLPQELSVKSVGLNATPILIPPHVFPQLSILTNSLSARLTYLTAYLITQEDGYLEGNSYHIQHRTETFPSQASFSLPPQPSTQFPQPQTAELSFMPLLPHGSV